LLCARRNTAPVISSVIESFRFSWRPAVRKLACLMVLLLIVSAKLVAAPPDETSRLTLQVLTEESKKPVPSAHVVVRFVSGKKFFIKDKRTSWEAQTDKRGELTLDDVPLGRVKVQVIARGYQTFGNEFELTKSQEDVTILLKPPAKQVSAY
jgi:hypothetical protein